MSEKLDWKAKRLRRREQNKAKNRLLSIQYDVDTVLRPIVENLRHNFCATWPLFGNQRCGSWYSYPLSKKECYFKSADGHVGSWKLSLKRLNLPFLRALAKAGGCYVVDASRTKVMPDSFSRTIPVWSAVMNRFALDQISANPGDSATWTKLHCPSCISNEEASIMSDLVDQRYQELIRSQAILRPEEIRDLLSKPLRPVWISSPESLDSEELHSLQSKYLLIVCIICQLQEDSIPLERGFLYSQGAADDEESWAFGLTPDCFWKNKRNVLKHDRSIHDTDELIRQLVGEYRTREIYLDDDRQSAQQIGSSGVWIGSRRAGRPPECWDSFDAVLNVTINEYEEMTSSLPSGKFYLQLPVEEGKRDRHTLEKWMAVGVVFVLYQCMHKRKTLIHCNQGRDRSAAIAIAFINLFIHSDDEGTRLKNQLSLSGLFILLDVTATESKRYAASGLGEGDVLKLLGGGGRDILFEWYNDHVLRGNGCTSFTIDKHAMRIALQTLKLFREEASPSRSTMQKLNRFFMSSSYETTNTLHKTGISSAG